MEVVTESRLVRRLVVSSIAWLDPLGIDVGKAVILPFTALSSNRDPALAMWLLKQAHLIVVNYPNHGNSETPGRTPLPSEICSRCDSLAKVRLRYVGFRTHHCDAGDVRFSA